MLSNQKYKTLSNAFNDVNRDYLVESQSTFSRGFVEAQLRLGSYQRHLDKRLSVPKHKRKKILVPPNPQLQHNPLTAFVQAQTSYTLPVTTNPNQAGKKVGFKNLIKAYGKSKREAEEKYRGKSSTFKTIQFI
mmetsp:Transcript_2727/g.4639  ORF Transcript_2727/g.4639 Transcript_2727/m.4639 type:complete len:133 (+) Transcript_2727:909-1307(+)